jgi:uncharacterized protein (TIGR02302 family)
MNGPSPPRPKGLGARLLGARLALVWEKLWPALWPVLAVAGLFLALALFDVLPLLHPVLHIAALAIAALALAFVLWRAQHSLALPSHNAAQRRIEVASATTHRPLATLADRAASDDPLAATLWRIHQERLAATIPSLRAGWPRPQLARRDPYAMRAALALVVVTALGFGYGELGERLTRAVTPGFAAAPAQPAILDLWITPPAYTGVAPLLPQAAERAELAVPAGSAMLAQVTGGRGAPQIQIDGGEPLAFEAVDERTYRISASLSAGTRLTVRQGAEILAQWPLRIIPDNPPTVELVRPPERNLRGALRLEYRARDDYGVNEVNATIRRADGRTDGPGGESIEMPLPLSGTSLPEVEGTTYSDLTAHPWAGLPVRIVLRATDAANQVGESAPLVMPLPERLFRNPVARQIVEQRKRLINDPADRAPISRALLQIAADHTAYRDDLVVFLALKTASTRLLRGAGMATVDAVQTLLWDTALRLEDGNVSIAERDMRALMQQLQDAIARGASDEEIQRLMAELRQAIDRYLQAMAEQARRNPDQLQRADPNQRMTDRNSLQRMLDQARQMARTGARDQARDLLQRLQDMLENMRMAQEGQAGEGEGEGGDSQAGQMLQQLQDLLQRQQLQTDRTFRRSQQSRGQQRPGRPGQQGQQGQQPGQPGAGEGDDDGSEQDAIRRELGDLMRGMGEAMGDVPGGFGRAEQSMRDAIDQLQRGNAGRALRPQMDALDQMRQGARELIQRLQEMAQGQEGEGQGEQGDMQANPNPLADEQLDHNGLGSPNARNPLGLDRTMQMRRSQEILEELIRRAGERFRPRLEREYLERLLRRF